TQPTTMPTVIISHFRWQWRARSDDAHISKEYVPKLRELVDAEFPHPSSKPCNSWILRHLEDRTAHFVVLHELFQASVRVRNHGPKLIERENPPVETTTLL